MTKKSKKNKKKVKRPLQEPAAEGSEPTSAPPAAALGTGRILRTKVRKPSAKEQAALDKKAVRAKWSERMASEGR